MEINASFWEIVALSSREPEYLAKQGSYNMQAFEIPDDHDEN
jgi:hypothetical protein